MPDPLAGLTDAVTSTMLAPWDGRAPDLRIQLEAAAARIDVAEHVRRLAGALEDRLGLNTWEARRARHHERLEHTRDMLNTAHESALRHLGGDLPTGREYAGVPIHADLSLEVDVIEFRDDSGRVLARRDSRGRFLKVAR